MKSSAASTLPLLPASIRSHPLRIAALAVACVSFVLPCSDAAAQAVFKCTESGKTVYQATACASQGSTLDIAPGPTEEDAQAAKRRAEADKLKSAVNQPAAPTPTPPNQQQYKLYSPRKIDCAKLDAQRTAAYGRRNGALRAARVNQATQSAVVNRLADPSAQIDRDNNLIRSIEAEMMEGGCKPG